MKAIALGTALSLAALCARSPAQAAEIGGHAASAKVEALKQRVVALQAAKGDAVTDAWLELERFVAGATDLPAALRTEALSTGLGADLWIVQVLAIKSLANAPDGPRAAYFLLEACRKHELREQKVAAERWRPEVDPQEARILGYEVSDAAIAAGEAANRAQAFEVVVVRDALFAACRSNSAPDATRGLVILVRCLAPEPAFEPVFAALLERRDEVVPEGVTALFEAAAAPRATLRQAVEAAKARPPRPMPKGERKASWEASEKKVGKLILAHREWVLDRFEKRLDTFAAQAAAFAKDAGLPSPPVRGSAVALWRQWRAAAEKVIATRAGKAGSDGK